MCPYNTMNNLSRLLTRTVELMPALILSGIGSFPGPFHVIYWPVTSDMILDTVTFWVGADCLNALQPHTVEIAPVVSSKFRKKSATFRGASEMTQPVKPFWHVRSWNGEFKGGRRGTGTKHDGKVSSCWKHECCGANVMAICALEVEFSCVWMGIVTPWWGLRKITGSPTAFWITLWWLWISPLNSMDDVLLLNKVLSLAVKNKTKSL